MKVFICNCNGHNSPAYGCNEPGDNSGVYVKLSEAKAKDYLGQVQEFHELFSQPVKDEIGFPDQERQQLRLSLIREEFNELREAVEQKDFTEVIDALCDLQYVLSGTVLEFGLKDKFDEFFVETHRSNMSKACSSFEEAKATAAHYAATKGFECEIEQKGDFWIVYRKSDGKVLKSINYSPVSYNRS